MRYHRHKRRNTKSAALQPTSWRSNHEDAVTTKSLGRRGGRGNVGSKLRRVQAHIDDAACDDDMQAARFRGGDQLGAFTARIQP